MGGAFRPDGRLDARRLDDGHRDPPGLELDAEHVGERLERVLRRCVRAEERQCAPAPDRAHQDDAPPRASQRGKERLRDGDLPDDVHLELAAELVERDELERRRDRDPGIGDEAVELAADHLGGRSDLPGIRHVELEGLDSLRAKRIGVGARPHAAVDAPAGAVQAGGPTRARFPTMLR